MERIENQRRFEKVGGGWGLFWIDLLHLPVGSSQHFLAALQPLFLHVIIDTIVVIHTAVLLQSLLHLQTCLPHTQEKDGSRSQNTYRSNFWRICCYHRRFLIHPFTHLFHHPLLQSLLLQTLPNRGLEDRTTHHRFNRLAKLATHSHSSHWMQQKA